ncbi:MAG: hypothetical protein L3J81_01000 [Thermoplasmata archaeon]|jgi:hypothetical protein|nr:hypothetical protein [Thermoplasmata archaeon]
MQSRGEHGGWVASEGIPPLLLVMWVGGAVVAIVVLGIAFAFDLLQPSLGVAGSVALVALIAIGDIASDLFFANQVRPRAVRAEPDAVEVRPLFGGVRRLPWSGVRISTPPGTAKFVVLQYSVSGPSAQGVYLLSSAQAVAIRSSPYRPSGWSEAGPGRR